MEAEDLLIGTETQNSAGEGGSGSLMQQHCWTFMLHTPTPNRSTLGFGNSTQLATHRHRPSSLTIFLVACHTPTAFSLAQQPQPAGNFLGRNRQPAPHHKHKSHRSLVGNALSFLVVTPVLLKHIMHCRVDRLPPKLPVLHTARPMVMLDPGQRQNSFCTSRR